LTLFLSKHLQEIRSRFPGNIWDGVRDSVFFHAQEKRGYLRHQYAQIMYASINIHRGTLLGVMKLANLSHICYTISMTHHTPTYVEVRKYFLELLIRKQAIHREIEELIAVVDQARNIHPDYKIHIKQYLYGTDNIYLE
jgi:hypothetical protein